MKKNSLVKRLEISGALPSATKAALGVMGISKGVSPRVTAIPYSAASSLLVCCQ